MKRIILLAILAITITTRSYDQQLFLQKQDTLTVDLNDLFDKNYQKPFPETPQTIYTYVSDSTAGRVASAREGLSGNLNKDSVNCGMGRVIGTQLLAACGDAVAVYDIDQTSYNLTYKSSMKSTTVGTTLRDFTTQGDFWAAVSAEASKLTFYYQDGTKVTQKTGSAVGGNRVRVHSLKVATSWMIFGYEKGTIGQTSTGANTVDYVDVASAFSGSKALVAANNFVDDAEHILDLQFTSKNIMFATYTVKGSNTPLAAYCDITTDQGQFAITKCTKIALSDSLKNGRFSFNVDNESQIMTYEFNTDTMMFTQCQLTAEYKMINCLSNIEKIRVPTGQVFYEIQSQGDSNSNFIFASQSSISSGTASQFTIVFNIRNKMGSLAYDQVSDINSFSFVGYGTYAYILRQNTFSFYNVAVNPYLVINSIDFPEGYGSITIENNDGHNPIRYRTVSIKILQGYNSYAGLNEIARSQFYIDGNLKSMPVSTVSFNGNNPEFQISNPDSFSQYYVNTIEFDQSQLGSSIWFTSFGNGITLDGNTLYKFNCTGHIHEKKTCAKDTNVQAQLEDGHSVIYVSTTEFSPEDGIVVVTTKDKTLNFYYFGVQYEEMFMKSVMIKEPVKAGDVYFKITGKLYTFWVNQKNQILLFSVYNKEFGAMPDFPYGFADSSHVKGGATICPVSVQKCPIQPTIVHVLSNCPGDNRLFTFYASNVTGLTGTHERSLNDIEIGAGDVKVCTLGFESIVFNPTTGSLLGIKTHDEYSMINIAVDEAGYDKVTDMFCVRDQQAAVIVGTTKDGKSQFSVLNGNKQFDERNRFHSTVGIKGTVESVSRGANSALIVHVKETSSYSFYGIFLNGPTYLYDNSKPIDQTTGFTISLSVGGKVIDTQPLNITNIQFNGKISVEATESHNSTAGVYDFFDLATVSGPIFDISVENSGNTTITPRLMKDTLYNDQIQAAINLYEPDFIRNQGRYAVGFRTFAVSTLVYYYHNYDQFWYMEDTGYLCDELDVAFSNQDFLIAAMACNEGGEFHLRWFIKSFTSGSGNDFIKRDVVASEVKITQINENTFFVVAIDGRTKSRANTAETFVLTVSNDGKGNYWVSNSLQTTTITDSKKKNF